MSTYTKEEIALVLQIAELLKTKGSSLKINVSQFCKEANISRKNAYKHKNKIDTSPEAYEAKLDGLEKETAQLKEQLRLAEMRAKETDLHSDCREFLKQYVKDKKKNPAARKKYIENYNKLAVLHGLTPLDFLD